MNVYIHIYIYIPVLIHIVFIHVYINMFVYMYLLLLLLLVATSVQECHRNEITGLSYPATLSQDYTCCLKRILYNARKLVGIN